MAADLEAFGASVASSSWWDTVRTGYCAVGGSPCVGDGPTGTSVRITTAAASSYTDSFSHGGTSSIQDWIGSAIARGVLPRPDSGPISNTVYLLYFPKTTTITADTYTSCAPSGFDGYHSSMPYGSTVVSYGIVVECDPVPRGDSTVTPPTLLQNTTVTASHEILEIATDPDGYTSYALDPSNLNNRGWIDALGAEAGDMCIDPFVLNQDQTSDGRFTVQRTWSISQAAAGVDPCVPVPTGEVYFNAAPARSFFVLDVGQSVTFEVDAFSTGPMSDWILGAQDWSYPAPAPYLSFSITGGQTTDAGPVIRVNNGSKVQVTATLVRDPGALPGNEANGSIISVSYALSHAATAHFWSLAVMTHADAADAGIDAAGLLGRRTHDLPQGPAVRRRLVHPIE
jgi:hypothetical protein